ncbi:hypothetical protein ACFL3V_04925 [Nanoarchaeota archaeon]
MFCPKCKSILKPSKQEDKVIFTCPNCGITTKPETNTILTEKRKQPEKKGSGVADQRNILAVHNHTCTKCGHNKAELIEQGVWYTDEDHVVLYKCGKCGHTERADAKVK